MNDGDLSQSLTTLFSELVHGAPAGGAFVLNSGDAGLLGALDRLSADSASASSAGGATIAAHVDHLRYGLSLMNRWAEGENPFEDADWAPSWMTGAVSDVEWSQLRSDLREEVERWHSNLQTPRDIRGIELNGVIGSVVHLAYHLGAIRQIEPALRGPRESERVNTQTRKTGG